MRGAGDTGFPTPRCAGGSQGSTAPGPPERTMPGLPTRQPRRSPGRSADEEPLRVARRHRQRPHLGRRRGCRSHLHPRVLRALDGHDGDRRRHLHRQNHPPRRAPRPLQGYLRLRRDHAHLRGGQREEPRCPQVYRPPPGRPQERALRRRGLRRRRSPQTGERRHPAVVQSGD